MDEVWKKQYVEEMYREVVKSFPGVEEDKINIIYLKSHPNRAGYLALNIAETKKEPRIIAGDFFDYPKDEQKADIAHEIGHHATMKNYTIPRLKRIQKWTGMYNLNQIPASKPHWKERLRKWHILKEIAADNKAADAGYGKPLLKSYKHEISRYDKFDENWKKMNAKTYENFQILAANLEQKLGVSE